MKTKYFYLFFAVFACFLSKGFAADQAPQALGFEVCIQPNSSASSNQPTQEQLLDEWNMRECEKKDCPLSRKDNYASMMIPHLKKARERFEAFIIERIVHDNNPDNPLVYTSVGSGWLLQDYVIIEKLKQRGFKTFILNFIDPLYKAIKEDLSKNQTHAQPIFKIDQNHPYAQKESYLRPFMAFKQLCGQTTRVLFYDSCKDYETLCQTQKELKAHVLVSIDAVLSDPEDTLLEPFLSLFESATQGNSSFYILTYLRCKHASLFTVKTSNNMVQHYYLCPSMEELQQKCNNDVTKIKSSDLECIQNGQVSFELKISMNLDEFHFYSIQ
jgi:hypothetical protein